MPSQLLTLVADNNLEQVKILLDNHVSPNTDEGLIDGVPAIPLHMAIHQKHFEMAKLLLAYKANPNMTSKHYEQTALHIAGKISATEMIFPLIRAGADLNVEDYFGDTPANLVTENVGKAQICESKELAACLNEFFYHESHIAFLTAIKNNDLETVQGLMSRTFKKEYYLDGQSMTDSFVLDLNYEGGVFSIPVHLAAGLANPSILEILMSKGADPIVITAEKGFTLLHIATAKGHLECLRWMLSQKKLCALINNQNDDKNSCLHIATEYGHAEIVELLLSLPYVNRNLKNIKLDTAFDMAKKLACPEKKRYQIVLAAFQACPKNTATPNSHSTLRWLQAIHRDNSKSTSQSLSNNNATPIIHEKVATDKDEAELIAILHNINNSFNDINSGNMNINDNVNVYSNNHSDELMNNENAENQEINTSTFPEAVVGNKRKNPKLNNSTETKDQSAQRHKRF